ncbi:DUF1350 family protein [Nodosilinea sp. PGN35]|uniref:DUF1350 family protein n=1 Tax=Nodosilinea sp. PGN35 TaxID=3020489 RepID=UPI0023B258C5|nr:DUF1350 family protein [Nodosilinea sp. TSF1-S3]MDF0367589.1 DUF1350 family protein [Nodosilinea sp. TSF1-S3]
MPTTTDVDLPQFRFRPLKTGWAAIHPQPQGVIFFIGGAFFGTFPTVFYRYLLRSLYYHGYTLVALPFRFSFRHWSVAVSIAAGKTQIRQELSELADQQGYSSSLYREEPNSAAFNYLWLGHSLGCKYIALLELLTDRDKKDRAILNGCIEPDQARRLTNALGDVPLKQISLLNQPSILLDPVVSDLEGAVPIKSLRALVERFIRVEPSIDQTYCLINRSQLFALTSVVAFTSQLARETVGVLEELLKLQLSSFKTLPLGNHLAAIGFKAGNAELVEAVLHAIDKAKARLPDSKG